MLYNKKLMIGSIKTEKYFYNNRSSFTHEKVYFCKFKFLMIKKKKHA